MAELSKTIQQADWKKEKHAPVIEAPATVKAGEVFEVKASLGKEIAHPNTTEHHISWIAIYFHPEGAKFPHHVGHFEFNAHGESVAGPNQGPVYTSPSVVVSLKIDQPGTLQALAFCNIHGLWESTVEIGVS
jgi:superoxide reductase